MNIYNDKLLQITYQILSCLKMLNELLVLLLYPMIAILVSYLKSSCRSSTQNNIQN